MPDLRQIAVLLVIAATLLGVAIGRVPRLHMNRATIALVGAVAVVWLGAFSLEDAYAAIDLNTLALLFAMMVLNANLRVAGFFDLVVERLGTMPASPRRLLFATVVASGVLSAVFLNDTIVLAMTPLLLALTAAARLPPLPYLMGMGLAANVGSVATIIGNPQNILIGTASGIPFTRFTARLAPVAIAGLLLTYLVVAWIYRRDLDRNGLAPGRAAAGKRIRPLLWKCAVAALLMIVAMVAGFPVSLAALGAAALLLITRRVRPEQVFREIDVSLLVFFAGLFVVTAAFERTAAAAAAFAAATPLAHQGPLGLSLVSVVLSNLVSNVPAVLLLRPVVEALPDAETGWLVLAMATTCAGNLTLLGSVANLLVAEIARGSGVELSFREFLRSGPIVTLATLATGVLWLGLT